LKTCSSDEKSFLTKGFIKDVFRGQASLPKIKKGISVPLPSKLTGFGKVDSQSSKKWYKVEAENIPPSPVSIKMNLLSEFATPCNTIEKIVCYCKTVVQLCRTFNVNVLLSMQHITLGNFHLS
jgi:hypothetical protein